ncbi:MAG: hypothetical protein KA369_22595 [Spirochaetes bacterium]|nr:hypothetical protein [Spirochaetota bacterium]
MKTKYHAIAFIIAVIISGVSGCDTNKSSHDKNSKNLDSITLLTLISPSVPVLNYLVISATNNTSITLSQPTLARSVSTAPTIIAYIGFEGIISISGTTVSGYEEGPVDVSSGAYTFNSLTSSTTYRIIVVAQNSAGYSVGSILQSTTGL